MGCGQIQSNANWKKQECGGDKTIESALEYEYLGDITRIGTNKRNLEERQEVN